MAAWLTTVVRLLGFGALLEILALIGLVVALRHRLVNEVRRVGAVLEAIAAAILRRAGYTVIETNNGVQALKLCQDASVAFNLVLSDTLMSGYTKDAMVNSAELPAHGLFVQKPFTPADLTQKVREAIDLRPRHDR